MRFFQANIQLFILFASLGLQTGFIYYLASKKMSLSKALPIMIGTFFISVSIIILSLFLLDAFGLINIFFPKEYVTSFFMAYFFLSCVVTTGVLNITSLFQGHKIFRRINQIQVIGAVLNFSVTGILFVCYLKGIFNIGIRDIFIGNFIATFVILLMWLVFFIKRFDFKLDLNISYVKEVKPLFIFVFLTYLGNMLSFLNYRLDLWFIHAYSTEYQVGLYSLAANLAQMFWYISNPISLVLLPYLSGKQDPKTLASFTFFSRINFFFNTNPYDNCLYDG